VKSIRELNESIEDLKIKYNEQKEIQEKEDGEMKRMMKGFVGIIKENEGEI
jgi:hypothetical protein